MQLQTLIGYLTSPLALVVFTACTASTTWKIKFNAQINSYMKKFKKLWTPGNLWKLRLHGFSIKNHSLSDMQKHAKD